MSEHEASKTASVVELMMEAVDEARALLKSEIALAREEATQQLADVKRGAITMGIAAALGVLSLAMLLMAMVLAISPQPLTALITGVVLLALAAGVGYFGYRMLPGKPMEQTQERLREDVELIREPEKGAGHTPVSVWAKPHPELAPGYRPRAPAH